MTTPSSETGVSRAACSDFLPCEISIEELIAVTGLQRIPAALLSRFISAFGRTILSRDLETVIDRINDGSGTDGGVRTAIKRLRRGLGTEAIIKNDRGMGYFLEEISPQLIDRIKTFQEMKPYPMSLSDAASEFNLPRTPAAILVRLAQSHGRFVTVEDLRQSIEDIVWREGFDATVRKSMVQIRRAIAGRGKIDVAHRIGFRLIMSEAAV